MTERKNRENSDRTQYSDSYLEFYYKHRIPEKDSAFFPKKQSAENRTAEMNERKYVSRSNICQTCFVAKSVLTQECNCD